MTVGRTEQINNSLNPDFKTAFKVPYFFEKVQQFKFIMIDDDGAGESDTIGAIEVTMGKLMGAKQQTYTANLSFNGAQNRG